MPCSPNLERSSLQGRVQNSISKVKAALPCAASSVSTFPHLLAALAASVCEPQGLSPHGDLFSPYNHPDIPQPHVEPWAFSLDLGLQQAAGSGHLLALGTPENPSQLSLHLQDQVRGVLAVFGGAGEQQVGAGGGLQTVLRTLKVQGGRGQRHISNLPTTSK